ncbi:hypothetical protein BC835DRAFT_1283994 [Cytidiella melzeri]|nr:hypothetical protein BC835DRAFT_1283994 [Cytidiella melzeri]
MLDSEEEDESDGEESGDDDPLYGTGSWQSVQPDTEPDDLEPTHLESPHITKSVVEFPSATAARPIRREVTRYTAYQDDVPGAQWNPWAPFSSKMDWEVAQWAKLRGPSSTAFTELLEIDGIADKLGLSFSTSRELNLIIDTHLPARRPPFKHRTIKIANEEYDVYFRDILECVKALFSNPEFTPNLILKPERLYADEDQTIRVYHDMHTGRWWWSRQCDIEKAKPGATIIPIIISSDKTQVTLFRNKSAYPVYLTIGNIPKAIRRKPSRQGQILLGYLPTSKLENITNKAAKRRILANLFHTCMRRILSPSKSAGIDGIEVTSGDGWVQRGHPIFACFVGDYPEQCLVTCTMSGDCPIGGRLKHFLGEFSITDPCNPRDLDAILDILATLDDGSPAEFARQCREARIRPVQHPFWEDLPYVHIYQSITPDVLHQLYQGVLKHVVVWVTSAVGADEIDARCRRLPPNHNIRTFSKGISNLSRISGAEHRQIAAILLGLVTDIRLPNNLNGQRLIAAVRSLLDFLFLAQYPIHTATTLTALRMALESFHDNKDIFVDLGIRDGFNLPKLHSLMHYEDAVKLFGTTDNYSTETTERLHIDLAKDAYRATNRKDEYSQMTLWLERREKILQHSEYIQWRLTGCPRPRCLPPAATYPIHLRMTKHPSLRAVSFADLKEQYGATNIEELLIWFLVGLNAASQNQRPTDAEAAQLYLPLDSVPVYHRVKFWNPLAHGRKTVDAAHARPTRTSKKGQVTPSRFDTVLVKVSNGNGINSFRVARLRAVFTLPRNKLESTLLPAARLPRYLAYVEWFSKFTQPEPHHKMHKVSRSFRNDGHGHLASVIDLASVCRSVYLFPNFGPKAPAAWTSDTVLDECSTFFVSPFLDRHTYFHLENLNST